MENKEECKYLKIHKDNLKTLKLYLIEIEEYLAQASSEQTSSKDAVLGGKTMYKICDIIRCMEQILDRPEE